MTTYRHTQTGRFIIAVLGIVVVATFWLASLVPPSPDRTIAFLGAVLLLLTLLTFWRLTVTVTEREIVVAFGYGWIKRRFPVRWIHGAEPVRNKWIYGWGIRMTPRGWMFNIAGLDAVELTFADGRKFRVGTDDPEGLSAAVRRVMGGTGAPD